LDEELKAKTNISALVRRSFVKKARIHSGMRATCEALLAIFPYRG